MKDKMKSHHTLMVETNMAGCEIHMPQFTKKGRIIAKQFSDLLDFLQHI